MSVTLNFSRSESIKAIINEEIEKIATACIEHFALPIIAGISMDQTSQVEFEAMGGKGKKPSPLPLEIKLEIYSRIKRFYYPKITRKITELVNSDLLPTLLALSDDSLRVAASNIKKTPSAPRWEKITALFHDHTCLFTELKVTTLLKSDLIAFHEKLCPIMCKTRDSGALIASLNLEELLH